MMKLSTLLLLPALCSAFVAPHARPQTRLFSTIDADLVPPTSEELNDLKTKLVSLCNRDPKASIQEVRDAVDEVESLGEQLGIGQASSSSGLLNGEWELLYSPEDVTRSSPFFWAFRRAFPENADQIFSITDAIPAPIKEVGPAFQTINFTPESGTGKLVSKVKVATLGGLATSIMTTRASITGADGLDGLKLRIETTKPEDSSVINTLLGPLGAAVNENAPAFPSGEALEQVVPGSSEVIMKNSFCDDSLRVSRNGDDSAEVFVWRRREFGSYEML